MFAARLVAILFAASFTVCMPAQTNAPALPQVSAAYVGDPRLEPIPPAPLHLGNVAVFGDGRALHMRFPPRVNGQSYSDGDNHADLFVLFDEVSGLPIDGQLPVLEAVPKGAAPGVPDLVARRFSAVWELVAVTVASTYDPSNLETRIDSLEKVFASPFTRRIHTTNLFLNCPIVPAGSTVDPGSPPLEQAWWRGNVVLLAPYDLEDGHLHPQVLFRFADAAGNSLPSVTAPHLVASHIPGEPFYSSIWEVWTVTVPDGFPVTTLRSTADVHAAHFPITSANVRLDCPVVAVETAPGSGSMQPVHFEPALELLRNDFSSGIGRFVAGGFRFDVPAGRSAQLVRDASGEPIARELVPAPFARARTFRIIATDLFPLPIAEVLIGLAQDYPMVGKVTGNFVPIILQQPFPLTPSSQWPRTASPDSTGAVIRFTQAQLDAAYAANRPPQLPSAIEQNIAGFIANGLLNHDWAPGGRPYAERLALVGRALHELVWRPEQGIQSIDTTSCVACHSLPTSGGASRGLYTLEQRDALGNLLDTINGGSMWGSGGAELLVAQKRALGQPVTFAHGATGDRDTIRHFVSKAQMAHFGIQTTEFIREQTNVSTAAAATMDLDGDGVVNEQTTGEVTAQAAFLLTLPVPDVADVFAMQTMGVTVNDVWQGRAKFRQPIAAGGAGCAACHVPFHPLATSVIQLRNPETSSVLSLPIAKHIADQDDVDEGYAAFFGEDGLRVYGDFKLHRMGSRMRAAGTNAPSLLKTAELWDCGSVQPLGRGGDKGSDLRAVIAAHEGVLRSDVAIARTPLSRANESRQVFTVKLRNNSPFALVGTAAAPLRLVVLGPLTPGAQAENVQGRAPDGTAGEGAWWGVAKTIPPGGSITLTVSFRVPGRQALAFDLGLADDQGYSEAVASARAFARLSPADQRCIIDFLRAQLVGGLLGE